MQVSSPVLLKVLWVTFMSDFIGFSIVFSLLGADDLRLVELGCSVKNGLLDLRVELGESEPQNVFSKDVLQHWL